MSEGNATSPPWDVAVAAGDGSKMGEKRRCGVSPHTFSRSKRKGARTGSARTPARVKKENTALKNIKSVGL